MYRRFFATGILAVVLLASGCSNHVTQNTEKTTQAVTEHATGESTKAEQTESASGAVENGSGTETKQSDGTNKQSENKQDKANKESEQTAGEQTGDEEIHTVIGTLEELGMDQVMLLSDNGNELTFSVEGVKIDLPSGIRIGNLIAVDYTGKINKKGTKKAAAVRIAGSADTVNVGETATEEETVSESATEKTTEKTTEKAQTSGKKQTVQGTLEKLSMTSLTLKDADGKKYTLPIINVPLYLENGLAKGTKVEVTYRGNLKDADKAESVEVLKIQSAQ